MSFARTIPNPVPQQLRVQQPQQQARTNPVQVEHLPQPSPTVAMLPNDPYAAGSPNNHPEYGNALLKIANYSEKSFVIYGDENVSKSHAGSFKALGGTFNGRLKQVGEFPGGPGWIFSFKFQNQAYDFVNKVNSGAIATQQTVPQQGPQTVLPQVTVPMKNSVFQTVRWKVFLPKVGMIVTIKADGNQLVGTVVQTETHRDIVDTCYIVVNQNTSKLVITNGRWQVLGYMVDHSVYFRENVPGGTDIGDDTGDIMI